jgi:hypothetical protein
LYRKISFNFSSASPRGRSRPQVFGRRISSDLGLETDGGQRKRKSWLIFKIKDQINLKFSTEIRNLKKLFKADPYIFVSLEQYQTSLLICFQINLRRTKMERISEKAASNKL